eukprot:GHUV01012018.1.p1 GENE.GHUV01012018.1~~GHUV01012018.1.p1  ORF type:complete len:283 (+),score=66.18 GHUV01012018.1:218-1066(+)
MAQRLLQQRCGQQCSSSRMCPGTTRCFKASGTPPRRRLVLVAARTAQEELRKLEGDRVRLRSEAEAPWRSLRLVLCGFSIASAGVATLISIPQLIGATAGVPGALATSDVLQNIAINLGAVGIFSFLFSRDWQAREKQMARLAREEALASLPVQLANGKRLKLGDLQSSSRVVVVAGTQQQVSDAVAAAEPYREQLQRRGVFVVPVVLGAASSEPPSSGPQGSLAAPVAGDLKWRATALNPGAWKEWFQDQLALAPNANIDRGLYVGLRLDGECVTCKLLVI